jgi:hypothetical protein
MHFMFLRAAGPPWVNGWVCADPQFGQAARGGGDDLGAADPSRSFATPAP